MARIYKPPPFTTILDRAHPLSRGLIFATLFEGSVPVDAATGYSSTPTGSPQTLTVAEPGWGAGADFPAAGTAHHIFSGYTSDTQWLLAGGISIFARGMCRSFAGYNNILIKALSNGSINSPLEFRLDSGTGALNPLRANAAGGESLGGGGALSATTGVVQSWGATLPNTNGINAVVYLNGVGIATNPATEAPYTGSNQPVWIGRRQDGATQFNGVLLAVYVWSRMLSAAEMLWVHKEPYAIWRPKIALVGKGSGAAPSAAVFRRTLSGLGTRTGSRQVVM
jgi:hypothetical protein